MNLTNLTTLFTTPLSNAAQIQQTEFKGSGLRAFQGNFELKQDNFTSNPISATFKSKNEIEQIAKSNPRIMAILKEYNIPLKVNIDVLEDMR